MTNLVHTKREELIQFIRQQMEGPGGCNDNYAIASENWNPEEEVLNTTPGSIYSTSVLFPKKVAKKEENTPKTNSDDENYTNESQTGDEEDNYTPSDRDEINGATGNDVDDEDIYSLNRRFPNTVGISCCLDKEVDLTKDIAITISGRYYTKLKGGERTKVQGIVKKNKEEFEAFFKENELLKSFFSYSDGKVSAYDFSKQLNDVRNLIKDINFKYAELVSNKDEKLKKLFVDIADRNRFLLSYRDRLFSHLTRLKDEEYLSEEEKAATIKMLKEIEKYECFISYLEDLIDMYDKKSFGFWESHTFNKVVDLSSIIGSDSGNKVIYAPKKNPCLKEIIKEELDSTHFLALDLWLQLTINSKDKKDKDVYLKILLQNTSTPFEEDKLHYFSIVTEGVNKLCFFGVRIDIVSDHILPYHENGRYKDVSKEEDKLDFLYRDIKDYGVGHLCSVDWDFNENNKVNHVFSEFIPSYETPDIEAVPRNKYAPFVEERGQLMPPPFLINNQCLNFKWLSTIKDTTDEEIQKALLIFVDTYRQWIDSLESKVSEGDKSFARYNIEMCRKDHLRMRSNVQKILSDKDNMLAFRLMNTAMFMQLWHNNKKQTFKADDLPDFDEDFYRNADEDIFNIGSPASWRPFQLAFILLNLDGIIQHPDDIKWEYRNDSVDLVWFPTGGGKTEAYLGIIGMSIIFRRRKYGEKGYGVSTIMRYTLRLLTNQQFQRALSLILALEQIRRWGSKYKLGTQEISIGLYVGSNSLPNKREDLDKEATSWTDRNDGENNTKIPLDRCPWCGGRLEYVDNAFCCSNDDCTFEEGLPVRLCDEDIYNYPPTLLFGTVDKFASIAHKVSTTKMGDDSRRLFGKGKNLNVLPPDLIIQDELHLLLGPLGSAVSLFECAIDQLCTRDDGTRPKIISSTATTRNTDLQIRALYDRNLNIFPKNGIDYDDSFFAFYRRTENNNHFESKRKYIGIMPTGRTQMTTQMRLSAILFVHRALFEIGHQDEKDFEKVADNYYSIISYFNSLKEVGKTDALFYIEYVKYLRRLYKRVLRNGDLMECYYAGELTESEISGRLSASDVNKTFTEVATHWTLKNRLPHKEGEKWVRAILPPDYILATNMISVGLDVSRFNTIIMNSMPRNIAEYIQASSRVARNVHGLVITSHNPFRSRDVSHFEKFREFHEKLYYYVEPISITPFSKKSVEKYFSLYMAALIRHSFKELADGNSAKNLTTDELKKNVHDKVMAYIYNRYSRTMNLPVELELQKGLLTEDLKNNIEAFVDDALDQWETIAKTTIDLVYKAAPFRGKKPYLFIAPDAYDDEREQSSWTVPTSLRIVEPEAVLHVKVK